MNGPNNSPLVVVGSNCSVGNEVRNVMLYGIPIVSLLMDGQERLCLAQISNTLLKNFSYNEIHNRRVALGITCVQCTPVQLELLRRAGAMPVSSRRCGMITKREAERLCKSFLAETEPPKLPESFSFDVYHSCAWGCRGSFTPSRYNSSRAKCIKCSYCALFFSPNKFIFHSHRLPTSKYVQPDAANFNSWRRHIKLVGNPEPSDHIIYAWEDVKAMFNGGSRKRAMTSTLHSFTKNQEHHHHHHRHSNHNSPSNQNTGRSTITKDGTKRETTNHRTSVKSRNVKNNFNNDEKNGTCQNSCHRELNTTKSIDNDDHMDDENDDDDDEDEDIECDVGSLDDDYLRESNDSSVVEENCDHNNKREYPFSVAVQSIMSNRSTSSNSNDVSHSFAHPPYSSGHHVQTLIESSINTKSTMSLTSEIMVDANSPVAESSSSSLNDIVDSSRNGIIKNFLFDGYHNSCYNSAQYDRQHFGGLTTKTFKPTIQSTETMSTRPPTSATSKSSSSSSAIAAAIFSSSMVSTTTTAKGSPSSSSSSSSTNRKSSSMVNPCPSSPPSSRLTSPTLSHSSASSPQAQPTKACFSNIDHQLITTDINTSLLLDYDNHLHSPHSTAKLVRDKMNQRWLQNLNSSTSGPKDSIYSSSYTLNGSSSTARINEDNRDRIPIATTTNIGIISSSDPLFSSAANRSAESIMSMSNPAILSTLLSTGNNARDSCPAFSSYGPIRANVVDNANLMAPTMAATSDNLAEIMWKACMASNVRATLPYANFLWPSLPPPTSIPTGRSFMDLRDSSPDSTQAMNENGALSKDKTIIRQQSNSVMPGFFPSFLPNLMGQNLRLFPPPPPPPQQCCPQSPNYLGRMINDFGPSSTNQMLRFATTTQPPHKDSTSEEMNFQSSRQQSHLMTNSGSPTSSITAFESFKNRITEDIFYRNMDPVNTFRSPSLNLSPFKQSTLSDHNSNHFMFDHRTSQDLYMKHYGENIAKSQNINHGSTTTTNSSKRKSTQENDSNAKKNNKKNKRSFLAISTLVSPLSTKSLQDNNHGKNRPDLIDLSRNVKTTMEQPVANKMMIKIDDKKIKDNNDSSSKHNQSTFHVNNNNNNANENESQQQQQQKIVPIDFSGNGGNNDDNLVVIVEDIIEVTNSDPQPTSTAELESQKSTTIKSN
ncbi:ski family transcriptional corepressor 2-like [Dermatophagoides farinae]|uniref:Ski family transcriptional corepressor 2-like n=1 Tax=Dermatophagoides farinae TaxID=6954 RepID=A0A9D4NWT8_DERFA|nr:rho GTPase-activating protein gacF-like [Dermatophagoides farinae]KAH7640199.1 ski family transcriptional corepressor 2-like [Dermatophagoides farinae]